MFRLRLWSACLAAALTCVVAVPGLAVAPPATLPLQGFLRTGGGGPVVDGAYVIFLRLYDTVDAKDPIWKEVQSGVQVNGGLFAMEIGAEEAGIAALVATGQALWIGVQVGSEPELPRMRLAAVPSAHFAYVAGAAAFDYAASTEPGGPATALSCSGCVGTDAIAAGAIADKHLAFTYAGSASKGGAADFAVDADHAAKADDATHAATADAANTANAAKTAEQATSADEAFSLACSGCVAIGHLDAGAKSAFVSSQGGTVAGDLAIVGDLGVDAIIAAGLVSAGKGARLGVIAIDVDPCAADQSGLVGLDSKSSRLHFCDGKDWLRLSTCKPACAAPETVTCGTPIIDGCGDISCGTTGSKCAGGKSCEAGECVCTAGTKEAPALGCAQVKQCDAAAGSGKYWLDADGVGGKDAFEAYCDMGTDGGGWMLLYAYNHIANQSKPLDSTVLPTDPIGGHSHRLMKDIGYAEDHAKELRFYCQTSAHGRKIHFKTANAKIRLTAWDGASHAAAGDWSSGFGALAGHTGHLPASTGSTWSSDATAGFTQFPFYTGGTYHWGLSGGGDRWECDDYAKGPQHNVLYQVWVR